MTTAYRRYYALTLAALLLAGASVHGVQYWLQSRPVAPLAVSLSEYPEQLGDWHAVTVGLDQEIEDVLALQDYWSATYRGPDRRSVSLLIGYYADEAIAKLHQPTVCYPGAGWTLRGTSLVRFPAHAAEGRGIDMNRLIAERGDQRQMVLYWFHVPGTTMTEPSRAKLHYLRQCLSGQSSRSMVKVQIGLPIDRTPEETLQRIAPFLRHVVAQLDTHLGPDWRVPQLEPATKPFPGDE